MPPIQSTEISPSNASLLLSKVLPDAIQLTFKEISSKTDAGTSVLEVVRRAWLRSLRDAFGEHYKGDAGDNLRRIAVFGGKPLEPAMMRAGVPLGIKKWTRWEFLYDVAVVNVEYIDAPFAHDNKTPLVRDAIWIVESEVALDGTQVAEDASKLRIARSENTLLIAAQPAQRHTEKWLEFLATCLRAVHGEVFIALVPSYATDSAEATQWLNRTVTVMLYRCVPENQHPQKIFEIRVESGQRTIS